ncbi:MAG: DNA alkylation repair protein [Desulfobacteraceae bacterium]|nr:MAG: DNA alkylation repair protein [Desulfobacteraceae bacterium]
MTHQKIKKRLKQLANREKAEVLQRFFKTGPGEYGEGDVFIGVKVPDLRKVEKDFQDISTEDVIVLLESAIHEERLLALLILVRKYVKGNQTAQKRIFRLYLKKTKFINSWDLVDGSAHHIVGDYLMDKNKAPLYRLAKSEDLWERRIAIVATLYFIKHGKYEETLKIAKTLLTDKEDLIHKAVGWMLREIGKRDMTFEEMFLKQHYKEMPRTMLRYAIEKFPEPKRQKYLKGEI